MSEITATQIEEIRTWRRRLDNPGSTWSALRVQAEFDAAVPYIDTLLSYIDGMQKPQTTYRIDTSAAARTLHLTSNGVYENGVRLKPVVPQPSSEATAFADAAVSWLCELPDRTSPEDWPEACLVTGEELHEYLVEAFTEAVPQPPAPEELARAIFDARLWPGAWEKANEVERGDALHVAKAVRCRLAPPVGVRQIVQQITERQQAICDGIVPRDPDWSHAHIATFIDLWNRFVCRIDGLDENSLRSRLTTAQPPAPVLTPDERKLVDYYLKDAEDGTDAFELAKIIARLSTAQPVEARTPGAVEICPKCEQQNDLDDHGKIWDCCALADCPIKLSSGVVR